MDTNLSCNHNLNISVIREPLIIYLLLPDNFTWRPNINYTDQR